MSKSVSIVLPALDEAEGILEAIDDAESALEELLAEDTISGFELIVVDDGSSDGTGALVSARVVVDPHVRLLVHEVNRGVGAGLRSALAVARHDLVLYTDADMPVDLRALRRALPLLAATGVGMVAGRRRIYGHEGGARTLASKAYDVVVRLALGLRERDVNFPFKLLDRELAQSLGLHAEGALADVELLARVHRLDLSVAQVVLDYRPRMHGTSKTMSWPLLRTLAVELIRERRAIRRTAGVR